MNIASYMKSFCELIEQRLQQLVPEQNPPLPYEELFRAARYSLLGGGKRLRPILTLSTTEALNGSIDSALTPACALEMVHTYSMIHDDLPCMDDDDFRRGKPSLHKAFPEGHAVLTGDFLLTAAFDVLANDPQLHLEKKFALIQILAKAAGAQGMIGGQVMDLEAEGKQIHLETLQQIHQGKTGALIKAAIEFGCVVAGASIEHTQTLKFFAEHIGLAFQVVDDILDITESEKKHGKSIASDLVNGKATYVTLLGLEESQIFAQSLYAAALRELDKLPGNTDRLREIAAMMVHRKT